MNESCHTYQNVHLWEFKSRVNRANDMWMSHVTHEWIMSRVWMSHVTPTKMRICGSSCHESFTMCWVNHSAHELPQMRILVGVTWLIHTRDMTHSCVTWLIHYVPSESLGTWTHPLCSFGNSSTVCHDWMATHPLCAMTCLGLVLATHPPQLNSVDGNLSTVCHDWFICHIPNLNMTWLI